eukprot:g1426.t1
MFSRSVLIAVGLLSVLLSKGVLGDGCHEVETDVGTELGLSADICSIIRALGRSPPDYVTAEAFYRIGFASKNPSLKDVATGRLSGEYNELAADYFANETWIDERLYDAFNGRDDMDTKVKRIEFIEKILQASLLGARMFSNLEQAYSSLSTRRYAPALKAWERALANHYGRDSTCSIFANGQARGIEFGTMFGGVSIANDEIGDAFGAGGQLIKNRRRGRLTALRRQIDIIRTNYIEIYLQAVVKYAIRIANGNNPEKAQAEGFAYYHAIAPIVRQEDADADDIIFTCFDITSEPTREKAQTVLNEIPSLADALDINEFDIDNFDDSRVDTYQPSDKLTCEFFNPFEANTQGSAFDSDR